MALECASGPRSLRRSNGCVSILVLPVSVMLLGGTHFVQNVADPVAVFDVCAGLHLPQESRQVLALFSYAGAVSTVPIPSTGREREQTSSNDLS